MAASLPHFFEELHRHILFVAQWDGTPRGEDDGVVFANVTSLAGITTTTPDGRCKAPEGEREAFALVLKRARLSRRQWRMAHTYRAYLYAAASQVRWMRMAARDEPRFCDPGGGMRHPDDWDEDGDW